MTVCCSELKRIHDSIFNSLFMEVRPRPRVKCLGMFLGEFLEECLIQHTPSTRTALVVESFSCSVVHELVAQSAEDVVAHRFGEDVC